MDQHVEKETPPSGVLRRNEPNVGAPKSTGRAERRTSDLLIVDRHVGQLEEPMMPSAMRWPIDTNRFRLPSGYDVLRLSIKPILGTETTIPSAIHDEYAHPASSQSLNGGADESFPFGPFD